MSDLSGEPQKIGHAIKQQKSGPSGCMTCMKLMQPEGLNFWTTYYFEFLTSKNLSKLSELSGFYGIFYLFMSNK